MLVLWLRWRPAYIRSPERSVATTLLFALLASPYLLNYDFVLLLIPFAIAEELGWMGYAADPLQERWGTLGASVAIGLAWGVWHWLPWYRIHGSIEWVLWMSVLDVLVRALMFWLYNNTRGWVFLTVLFHASFNVGYRVFPNDGQDYDPFATVLVMAAITALVMSIWGTKTLASYRFSLAGRS